MSKFNFNIGAEVCCRDGNCGKLSRVVMDPDTERVTNLIVEKGVLLTTDRVLPVSAVESATKKEIHLSLAEGELEEYPEYHQEEFKEPAPGWGNEKQYQGRQILHFASRYGLTIPEPVVPKVRHRVHEGVSAALAVVERGTSVNTLDGELGTVDHVVVSGENQELTHVVVDRGFLSSSLVIPASKVAEVGDESIFLDVTEEELAGLPRYTPRDDIDIRAEFRHRLKAAGFDVSYIKSGVENGILHLTGVVPDAEVKGGIEAVARSVAGVIDVESALRTDGAIAAQVTAALSSDPGIARAVVGVVGERGKITLTGQVDSAEVRAKAEEVAVRQPGVVQVVNELDVEPGKSG